ncbi:MAG: hypothetical protein DI562_01915 [Stenotrophomonas acidaminiphila]|nr:MAG: hypothetical protein DI562_01915 [Stenotrophomonas acidaminiphila]
MALYVSIIAALPGGHAFAQSSAETDALRSELQALREEQSRITELQQRTEAAIAALEARMGVTSAPSQAAASTVASTPATSPSATAAANSSALDRLKVSGDFRLRGQHDRSDADARDRTSGQIRARLGATFAVNDLVTVGGRVVI